MPAVDIAGFRQWTTNPNPRVIANNDISDVLNFDWENNALVGRLGSSKWKNNLQWPGLKVLRFVDFHRQSDIYFFVIASTSDGKLYWIRSDDPNYGTASATYTEILSPSSGSPALNPALKLARFFGFNDLLFVVAGSNDIYSWDGASATLTAVTNPTSLGTNNIVDIQEKSARIVALDDGGNIHLAAAADSSVTAFTAAGSGRMRYGRLEGLKATAIIPYKDDLIVTTEDKLLLKFQTFRLKGIQFYDATIPGSEVGQFEVSKESVLAGMIGSSVQEIDGDTIGLTPRGFVSVTKALSGNVLLEKDFLSYPIKEIIQKINFKASNKITSTVDTIKSKYYCAVPFGESASEANIILVFYYGNSSGDTLLGDGISRWSVYSSLAWEEIVTLGKIQGKPYVADSNGEIYKLEDIDADFADDTSDIHYYFKTAAIGGNTLTVEKRYSNLNVLFTNLVIPTELAKIEMRTYPVINNQVVNSSGEDIPITPVLIAPPGGIAKYDTSDFLYDEGHFYDSSGSNQRLVSLQGQPITAESMQWVFRTKTQGIRWGIGQISVDVEVANTMTRAGVDNNDV